MYSGNGGAVEINYMRDIQTRLELWGAWAASDNSGVDWKPIAAGFNGLLIDTKKSRPKCDDDEGILLDSCIACLKKFQPKEYELIIAHFVGGVSLRSIAKKRKCADGTIRKELQSAMGFINGCLCFILV